MKLKLAAVFASLMVVSVTLGSGAFTTAELTRSANIPLVDDDGSGIVGINVRNSDSAVLRVNSTESGANNGSVELDFAQPSSSSGANQNAVFKFGDDTSANSAETVSALRENTTITVGNNDTAIRTFYLTYEGASGDGTEVDIKVYNSSGQSNAPSAGTQGDSLGSPTVTVENTGTTKKVAVQDGGQLAVAIVVDSQNTNAGDLSGNLNITAT